MVKSSKNLIFDSRKEVSRGFPPLRILERGDMRSQIDSKDAVYRDKYYKSCLVLTSLCTTDKIANPPMKILKSRISQNAWAETKF